MHLFSTLRATWPSNFPSLDRLKVTIRRGSQLWSSSLCSSPLIPVTSHLSGRHILLAPCYQTPSPHILSLMWETKFYTHTKNWQHYSFLLIFWRAGQEAKDAKLKCSEHCQKIICSQQKWSYSIGQQRWKILFSSRDSVVGIATDYRLDDREVEVRVAVESRIFCSPRRPDRLWGPPNLLSNGYRRLFPRG
jgi:hypothetical protein